MPPCIRGTKRGTSGILTGDVATVEASSRWAPSCDAKVRMTHLSTTGGRTNSLPDLPAAVGYFFDEIMFCLVVYRRDTGTPTKPV